MGQNPRAFAARPSDDLVAGGTVAQRCFGLGGRQVKHVVAMRQLATVGEPATQFQGRPPYERERRACREVFVVFPYGIGLDRPRQGAVEAAQVSWRELT